MNLRLLEIKKELSAIEESEAIKMLAILRLAIPAVDELNTKEAQDLYGSKNRFNYHVREGHIQPVKGHGTNSRKTWSRIDVHHLKKSEKIVMKFV